jgi:hypothetical protein
MPNLRPSQVRALMLEDLEGLHASLDALARAADNDRSRLRECSADLRERLAVFLEREDSILMRALEETDFWGPNRLKTLRRAHAPDWAAVTELARAADRADADLAELAQRAKSLRLDLRRDLDQEERCLLIAEVLQDDVTSTDQSDG